MAKKISFREGKELRLILGALCFLLFILFIFTGEKLYAYNNNAGHSGIDGAADIAELFPVEYPLEAGDVVCVNENGKAAYCDREADTGVLGVISTSPAVVLKGDHIALGWNSYSPIEAPIALKGRVPVKVMCNAPINYGDLLVSSHKKGYAVKRDLDKLNLIERVEKMEGITLGKALEKCEEGERKIMVWVD